MGNRLFNLRSTTVLLAVLVVFSILLTACGTKQDSQQAESEGSKNLASNEQFHTIKHVMGETSVPANPSRVVILTNEGTEALLALDIKPVGAVESSYGNPWFDHIRADMDGVTVVGTESQP